MERKTKKVAGALMLLTGLPALAEEAAALKAVGAAACASCPPVPVCLQDPGGPIIWFAAGAAFGFVLALLAAKFFGNKRQ
jgi:hypothetical protein